jgi:hypothetical protein
MDSIHWLCGRAFVLDVDAGPQSCPFFTDLGVVACVLLPLVLLLLLQSACDSWQEGVESLRKDMAAGKNPSPDRVRDLLLSAAATGAALGHMDDLQVSVGSVRMGWEE